MFKKVFLLFLCVNSYQLCLAQCNNPTPTGAIEQTFCRSDVPIVDDLVASGGNIVWYNAAVDGTVYDSNEVLNTGLYYADDISGGDCSITRLEVSVFVFGEIPETFPTSEKCAIEMPKVSDLLANGVNGTLDWYDTEIGGVPLPLSTSLQNGTVYWAQQTENGCVSERSPTTVILLNTSAPTADPEQIFCAAEIPTVGDLEAEVDNPANTVTWYATETATMPLGSSELLVDQNEYWASQTEMGCEGMSRIAVLVTVNITPPPTSPQEVQTFCEIDNATISDLEITGSNIQWYADALSTEVLDPSEVLVDGEDYFASQTDDSTGCESVDRAEVIVSINSTPAPTTPQAVQTFCDIDNATISDLEITGSNIQWYADALSTAVLDPSEVLVDGEDYFASQIDETSGCESVNRIVVTVNIGDVPAPSVPQEVQTFCEIDNTTIADLQVTGSNIKWYSEATSTVVLDLDEALIDGEDYFATQTVGLADCESEARTEVIVAISNTPAPITPQASQVFCESDNATISDLEITGSNIQWYVDAESMEALDPTQLLVDGEDYFASQIDDTTGCESTERVQVTSTINNTPAPTTGQVSQNFCAIENATIADLEITGSNIQWYADALSTEVLDPSEVLVDSEDYFASQIDDITGCESAERQIVSVTINSTPAPTTTQASQFFCESDTATIADLEVTGSNIQWFADAMSTVVLDPAQLLVDGEDYFATQIDDITGCESVDRLQVFVIIKTTPAPTTPQTDQFFCEISSATISDLEINGTSVQWYADAVSTIPLDPAELLIDGEDYFATQADESTGCESTDRTEVIVTIGSIEAPSVPQEDQFFCEIDNATVNDLDVTGSNIQWYADLSSTIPLDPAEVLMDGEDYFATQSDTTGECESIERTQVTVTINSTDAPTTPQEVQFFCQIDNGTIADLDITGSNIQWFSDATSTVVLELTELLIDGEDYFASQVDDTTGCESIDRAIVTVSIDSTAPPTTDESVQFFCESDLATISDLQVTGINVQWYPDTTSIDALDPSEILIDGEDYYATQISDSNGCESRDRLPITVELNTVGTPFLKQDFDDFCISDNLTLADLNANVSVGVDDIIVWFDDFPNGSVLDLSTVLADGTAYYAVAEDSNGCQSADALEIFVDLINCGATEIVLFDGFSPNDNGINDTFNIPDIEVLYPDYTIEFFNRWGDLVYSGNANEPSWNGKLNGTGELVPVGVYFYVIMFNKEDKEPIQGRLYLSR